MYSAEIAKGMSASTGDYGSAQNEDRGIRAARQTTTVSGLLAQAADTQKYATDRAMSVDVLAGRALDIATRLTGSFAAPGGRPATGLSGERVDGPDSALDALQITIGGIRGPLSAMDDSFHRLAAALDAIDRALS